MTSIRSKKINILLTGKPGIGKTTVIKKIIEKYKKNISGFYTEEIREKGNRVGFRIKNTDGEEGLLSHVDVKSRFKVGKYAVNTADIDKIGVDSINRALHDDEIDIIVIDEIAKMELFSENFKNTVSSALNSSKIVVGVIQDKNIEFLNRIRERKDVKIISITYQNRDEIAGDVIKIIRYNP